MLKNNSEIHVWSDLNNTCLNDKQNQQHQKQQLHQRVHNYNSTTNLSNKVNSPNSATNNKTNSIEMFDNINFDNEEGSCEYASIDACHEIDRNSLDLIEKLGSGQFGDVYRGTYKRVNFKIDINANFIIINNFFKIFKEK